ncbi:MAG: hypothetical protein IJF63_05050 [Alistipes sp.]|nr:hypothetical protein [Alistipes sp.]MBQ6862286.1 hypothetical protein [Alistipes sp.]
MPKKKGDPKTGGRVKGTPNKATSMSKAVIADLLNTYSSSGLMSEDFMALEPKDRLAIAERLTQYVMPKMQAVSAEVNDQRNLTIEDRLRELSGEES